MDTTEKKIEDYAFDADLTLPAAREITRLIDEAVELLGTQDEQRCQDYVTGQIKEAFDRGERWAVDYLTTQIHRKIMPYMQDDDPVAALQHALGVSRSTAEQLVREATAQ